MDLALKPPLAAPDPKVLQQKKILLIDDDPAMRQVLARLLAEEDYGVLPAANGIEALELVNNTQFDLALLDLNAPDMEGWNAFEKISSKNALLPFVVITAHPNQLFPAVDLNIGTLMEKPLDLPKLFHTIRNLLKEPPEVRLARMAGRPAEFHYVPPKAGKPESESELK
jgi:DNA-binding NtrC family response regulator